MPDTSELKTSIRKIALVSLKSLGVLLALYFFLFGLDLMSGSFGALGGKSAGQLFTLINNPIAGRRGFGGGFFFLLFQHERFVCIVLCS